MQGVDQAIHLVAIIREVKAKGQTFDAIMGRGTENVVQAAEKQASNASSTRAPLAPPICSPATSGTRYAANKPISSGLPYTIFRPSLLIGGGGELTALLKRLTTLPIVPVIGPGDYPMQPLYVRDIARYLVQSLNDDRYLNQTFEVGGPETLDYNDMMRQTLAARRKKGFLLHAPLFLVKPVVPLAERVLPNLLTRDQLTMLLEGSHTEDTRLHDLGGFELTPFRKAIKIALAGSQGVGAPLPGHGGVPQLFFLISSSTKITRFL